MRAHKGFSLLEILVAFAIMAVALTLVLRIFGSGVNAAMVSEDYTLAVQIAESLMARTGVEAPLQSGEFSGIEGDRFAWHITLAPVEGPAVARQRRFSSQQAQEMAQPAVKMMRIKVEVSWGDEGQTPRSLELVSLKLYQEPAL